MAAISSETVKKYAPAAKFHQNESTFPCSIEHLLQGSTLKRLPSAPGVTPFAPILNPTQKDLLEHPDKDYFVSIAESQWPGQPISQAPMYYAVQEDETSVKIHYIFLYAKQEGQTVRALRFDSNFDCVIYSYGEHPGDLERFMITLSKETSGSPPATTYTIKSAEFEAHGKSTDYPPEQVQWTDGTHAALNIGLNNHGIFNPKVIANPDWDVYIRDIVGIGNFFGNDEQKVQWWRPWESSDFKLLGLKDGKPVGDQVWAAFAGSLGDSYPTRLKGAKYFDGRKLKGLDWDYVEIVATGAAVLNKLPANVKFADAPSGPAARAWVTQDKIQ